MKQMTAESLLEDAGFFEAQGSGKELPKEMIDRMVARASHGGPGEATIREVRATATRLAKLLGETQKALDNLNSVLEKEDRAGQVVTPKDRFVILDASSKLYRMQAVAELVAKDWPNKRAGG